MRRMCVAALAQPLSVEYLLLDPSQYALAEDHPGGLFDFVRLSPGLDGDGLRFASVAALHEHCRTKGVEIAGDLHGCPGEKGRRGLAAASGSMPAPGRAASRRLAVSPASAFHGHRRAQRAGLASRRPVAARIARRPARAAAATSASFLSPPRTRASRTGREHRSLRGGTRPGLSHATPPRTVPVGAAIG